MPEVSANQWGSPPLHKRRAIATPHFYQWGMWPMAIVVGHNSADKQDPHMLPEHAENT